MVKKRDKEPTEPVAPEQFKRTVEEALAGREPRPLSKEETAELRRSQEFGRQLRAARRETGKYEGLEPDQVDTFWDAAISGVAKAALFARDNPTYGPVVELGYRLQDLLLDFETEEIALAAVEQLQADIVRELEVVYKGALQRSDARKDEWPMHQAAPLDEAEIEIQTSEIKERLGALGIDLDQHDRRDDLLAVLVTAADDIRRYRTSQEKADLDEYIEREGAFRGPRQAAAANLGQVLPDLLENVAVSDGEAPLRGLKSLRGRAMMQRLASVKRVHLRDPERAELILRMLDGELRAQLDGDLRENAMREIGRVIEHSIREQRSRAG